MAAPFFVCLCFTLVKSVEIFIMLIKAKLTKVICLISAENLNLLIPAQAPVLSYRALLYFSTVFFRTHKGPEVWTHTQIPVNDYTGILIVTSSLYDLLA